ncbi:MAG: hypothetical protein BWY14_00767 [Parcubacteria group bacterium ADurb.Bin192]|nr:MAG: hypothetical protein BWY14_00767 [Parcubacteria group bacterium ADurb.Bin192]
MVVILYNDTAFANARVNVQRTRRKVKDRV